MRVLHVVWTLDPAGGGPPFVAASLAIAQARLGADVRILTYPSPAPSGNVLTQLNPTTTIPHDVAAWSGWLARLSGSDAQPMLQRLNGSIDFAHLHGVWEPLVREAATACRRAGIPYAISPHGMLDPWSLRQSAYKKKLALQFGHRRMLKKAAFLHLLNEDEQQLLVPLKLGNAVEVVPNGIFPEQFADPAPRSLLQSVAPRLGDRRYVLFLSRLHYKKGLDYLADAFAILARSNPDVQLLVAGPDGGERGNFEQRILALKIADRVHITGPLYGEIKHAALANAAVFCLPSRQEGFSMAITEALACGTPCVISEGCHFPEVRTRGAGCVVALQPAEIAAALTRVLNDAPLRHSMSDAASALVRTEYTWPAIARRMLDAYERRRSQAHTTPA